MPTNEILLFVLFNLFVLLMLAIDLGVFHRTPQAVSLKEATMWSIVWIVLALVFNVGVWVYAGPARGLEFFTGYLIERALSMDNIFVFVLLFNYFGLPAKYQHKVLFWGVLGALIMRSIFILAGAALIAKFEWILYIFGVILIYSGWKMMKEDSIEVHPESNIFIRLAKKLFPVETGYETPHFFVRRNGKIAITTMFLVLVAVETTDVVFAVDSIPAVFAVTRDPFIVYSSNVFAILGLRAMYFLLAGVMNSFYYLKHGLSIVLIFVGLKMLAEQFIHISIGISLAVIAVVLAVSVWMSIVRKNTMSKPS
jgi:tellurite resistance protein TerC